MGDALSGWSAGLGPRERVMDEKGNGAAVIFENVLVLSPLSHNFIIVSLPSVHERERGVFKDPVK